MNVMRHLTFRYMKQNKSRTMVTVIGAIIAVAMLTAVFAISSSYLDLMQREAIEYSGKWQASFQNVAGEDVAQLTKAAEIEQADISHSIGFAELKESKNSQKPYVYVTGYSHFDLMAIKVLQGRLPENEQELVMSEALIKYTDKRWKVGDTLALQYGVRRDLEDGQLVEKDNLDPFTSTEQFTPQEQRSYTIVGIISAPEKEQDVIAAYRAFSGLSETQLAPHQPYTIDVAYKNYKKLGSKLYTVSDALAQQVHSLSKTGESKPVQVAYHRSLLLYAGLEKDSSLLTTLYGAIGAVLAIILIGSVSLIHNAFAISLSERSRALGMLSSVGATKQQKRASVFIEAGIIGILAIPAGILLGLGGIGLTFTLLNPFIQSMYSNVPIHLVLEPSGIVAIVLFAVFTLGIAAWLPARRASRMTPIHAIRQSYDLEIKSKDVRTSAMIRKFLGFEAELGLKNIKRNKHHYRSTVFSLAMSVVLFLSASTFSTYFNQSYEMSQGPLSFDMTAYVDLTKGSQSAMLLDALSSAQNATTILRTKMLYSAIKFTKSELTPDMTSRIAPEPDGTYRLDVTVVSMNDEALASYLKSAGIERKSLESDPLPAVLVNQLTLKEKHTFTDITQLTKQAGSTLPVTFGFDDAPSTETVNIAAVTAVRAPFMNRYEETASSVTLVVSEPTFAKLLSASKSELIPGTLSAQVRYTTEKADLLSQELTQILEAQPNVNSYLNNLVSLRQYGMIRATVTSVFLNGFVVLIAMISLTNILNTISTGMTLRRREFAMLQSFGMTPGGLKRMVRYEGMFYGIKSLAFGLPISLGVMILMYTFLDRNFSFAFTIPWVSVLIAILGVFTLVGTTMVYASNKLRGQNIVDALRNENL